MVSSLSEFTTHVGLRLRRYKRDDGLWVVTIKGEVEKIIYGPTTDGPASLKEYKYAVEHYQQRQAAAGISNAEEAEVPFVRAES